MNVAANTIDQHYTVYENTRLDILAGGTGGKALIDREIDRKKLGAGVKVNSIQFLKNKSESSSILNTNNVATTEAPSSARPTLESLHQRKSISLTQKEVSMLWEGLLSDLPYHRGDGPFRDICENCLSLLKVELYLWNLVFTVSSSSSSSSSKAAQKATKSFSIIAAKILNSLTSSLPSLLTAHDSESGKGYHHSASSSTTGVTGHSSSSSSSSHGVSSKDAAGPYGVLRPWLRHVNILLCNLDVLDTYLTHLDDFSDILMKSVSSHHGSFSGSSGSGSNSLDNNEYIKETIAGQVMMDVRNTFIRNFLHSCTSLLKSKWDAELLSGVHSGSTALALSSLGLTPFHASSLLSGSGSGSSVLSGVSGSSHGHDDSKSNAAAATASLTCDVHSVTIAIVHCCRVLSTFPESLYNDQIMEITAEINEIQSNSTQTTIPFNATSMRQLMLSLINNLLKSLELLSNKLNPPENVRKTRNLEIGHAKYTAGDNDAVLCLKWAQNIYF